MQFKTLATALADAIARWLDGAEANAGNPTPVAAAACDTADALASEIIATSDGTAIATRTKALASAWLSDEPRDNAGLVARLRMVAA